MPEVSRFITASGEFDCPDGLVRCNLFRNQTVQRNGEFNRPRSFVLGLADKPVGIPAEAARTAFFDPAPVVDHTTVLGKVISIHVDGELDSVAVSQVRIPRS